MRDWSTAAGFAAGLAVAGFGHREALGRQVLFYVRHAKCFRRASHGGIAAIGDSVTIGHGRSDWGLLAADSWLSHAIAEGDLPYCYNAGLPNQSTEWIAARLAADALARRPNVVVILTGTNDVLHGFPVERPMRLIRRMVGEVRASNAVPVLATLPPFAADPDRVREFNDAVCTLASSEGTPLIDFYSVVADGDSYRLGTSDDGLHPNVVGAREMGRAAIPALRAALIAARADPA